MSRLATKNIEALQHCIIVSENSTSQNSPVLQVAVANDGTIFVADGYCNSRVVRYSANGKFEVEYILPRGAMDTPHSLVLHECSDALYVADREHSEVHKFSLSDQKLQGMQGCLSSVINSCKVCMSVHSKVHCTARSTSLV